MTITKTGVLIVGGGGAACRAAIAAADQGVSVRMALKHTIGHSGATTHKCCEIAGFNVPGCGDPQDNEAAYYEDIQSAAMGMADDTLVDLLVKNVKPRFEELRSWGIRPAIQEGREVVMKGCYSNYRRGYTIPGHGEPIIKALLRQIRRRPEIQIWENTVVVDLLEKEGRCCGALVLAPEGDLQLIQAGAVVLATGGASQVFLQNLNPTDVSGDGYSLAYEHGAELKNMEFMQAGIGFFHPIKSLFNTYLWAGFPQLTNVHGLSFLEKHLPQGLTPEQVMREHCKHFPFSSRDISRYLEIAIQKELNAGGGDEHMCLSASFRHFTAEYIAGLEYDADLKQLWPMVLSHFQENGIDLCQASVGITCVAQAINGGISTDCNAMSTLPGLFAAGETAAGPHGADRLGGNMMGTCQVFGEIAGRKSAQFAASQGTVSLEERDTEQCAELRAILYRDLDAETLIERLQYAAQSFLFICRTQEKLDRMMAEVKALQAEVLSAPVGVLPKPRNLALWHLLRSAQLMTQAASIRKESRGSHYREDYPQTDPAFDHQIILSKKG